MKLTRVANVSINENILSSRSFVEKFYSEYNNEFCLSPVSEISYPDPEETYKIPYSSNFLNTDTSPNPTQEADVKTHLIKKFEEFLENLKSDELISHEEEIMTRLSKMNEIRSKNNEIFSNISSKDMDFLKRKYENLLIENNELDLELINSNMHIREKKNLQLKGILEIQRIINNLQRDHEELTRNKDAKKGKLVQMIQELNEKELKAKGFLEELNETIFSKELILKIPPKEDDKNKIIEIDKQSKVLAEIKQKNLVLQKKIQEDEFFLEEKVDIKSLEGELLSYKDIINVLTTTCVKLEKDIEDYSVYNKEEIKNLENNIEILLKAERDDDNHEILRTKYENPIQLLQNKKLSLKQEIQSRLMRSNEIMKEQFVKIGNQENKMKMLRIQYKELLEASPKKYLELKEKKEKSFKNTEELQAIMYMKQKEKKELEKTLDDLKNNQIMENNVFSVKKEKLVTKLKKIQGEYEIEINKKNSLYHKIEKLKTGKLLDSSEKITLIENLQKEISLMQDQRNKIKEEIPEIQINKAEKKKDYETEEKDNVEFSKKLEDINTEINKLKEDVSNCTKDNDEVCTKFKLQIEENSSREKELKNSFEIIEKLKELTENQMKEINKFNEKNNINFKEIAILEKGDIKIWNNYLKDKEKEAKKKKK